MNQFCEMPKEDEISFHLLNEDINQNEEEQKKLKEILSEFKKNRENKDQKKLYNSSNIKKVPNLSLNRAHRPKFINGQRNEDGTITETKIERQPDGKEKIIKTRYDRNHNVISRKIYYNENNINNNNFNYQNNNLNRGHIFKASNGYSIETKYETLPNGKKNEIKIIRDENDEVVDIQEDEITDNNMNYNMPYNLHNNRNAHPPMNSMPPPLNNNFQNNHFNRNNNMNNNMGRNPYMNNNLRINNPMYPMNNMNNYMNNNLNNNVNNMNYNNMNYNMRNMPMQYPMPMNMPMMNNFGFPFMNMMMPIPFPNPERIDPRILNSLPESEVADASKLDAENKNCVICLGDFNDKDKIICLPCIHVFHSDCIKSWLNNHRTCPTCKFELTFENLNSHSH